MKIPLLLAALAVVLVARTSHAEIMVVPTLEWLADHCIDSGVYVVASASKSRDSDSIYAVRLTLKRALRGNPQPALDTVYSDFRPREKRAAAAAATGHEFLVCCQHYENGDRWVTQLVNLTRPQTAGFNEIAVTSKLKILRDGKSIRDAFTARLKSHPAAEPVKVGDYSRDNRLELDYDSEVYRAIYSGSSCYARIPADLVGRQ